MRKPTGIPTLLLAACLAGLAASPVNSETATTAAPMKTPWTVNYHDGNGNGFRFWRDFKNKEVQFEYIPVRPDESSSGRYSGGEKKKGHLDGPGVQELWQWIGRLQTDASIQTNARAMGTGAFSLVHESRTENFIVKDGSQLREFNEFLGALLRKASGDEAPPAKKPIENPLPIYPNAVQDRERSGATSIDPGRNYTVAIYSVKSPLADVLQFYETRLKNFQRSNDQDGSIKLTGKSGYVRLIQSGSGTQIQIVEGPQ